jgi:MoxR-like ATPase
MYSLASGSRCRLQRLVEPWARRQIDKGSSDKLEHPKDKNRRLLMDQSGNLDYQKPMERVLYEVKKIIVGQDHLLERLVVALLARGHILVEGVPGLAKTMAIKTLAEAIGGEFKRIQFTPDLVPADLIGTRIYNQKTGEFNTSLGPVFTNLLLADEINRAPAKVQSALLEVMQEHQVTIGRETFRVPDPFLVLATQNPIETEGTYSLPEAQVDRFMLKVLVGYPNPTEEFVIVERMTGLLQAVQKVLTTQQLLELQKEVDRVFVDPATIEYSVRMVTATRQPQDLGLKELQRYILFGASPRASINLILTARALAFVRGRDYVLPQDVLDMALDVMRHRLVLSYEALSDNITSDDILKKILDRIPIPVVPLHEHSSLNVNA